jgi:hypothetical protein
MSDETPKATRRGLFPVIAAVVVIAAIYLFTQYGLMRRTSVHEQRVSDCTTSYRNAHTAADTAAVDAQIPTSDANQQAGQGKTCEYFRKAGTTK